MSSRRKLNCGNLKTSGVPFQTTHHMGQRPTSKFPLPNSHRTSSQRKKDKRPTTTISPFDFNSELAKRRALDHVRRDRDEIRCTYERLSHQLALVVNALSEVPDPQNAPKALNLVEPPTPSMASSTSQESLNFSAGRFTARGIVERISRPFHKKEVG